MPSPNLDYLKLALECAKQCVPVATAFSVGCVITIPLEGSAESYCVLATGYSRELEGNTHAEANALEKARQLTAEDLVKLLTMSPSHLPAVPQASSTPPSLDAVRRIDDLLTRADVYTTTEPCSVRLSGLAPCADALIAAKVKRCIIGVGEPSDFVQCEGARKLEAAGIEVIWMRDIEGDCLSVARRGH
jgi:pyrimidine deaminase RibD-like protein